MHFERKIKDVKSNLKMKCSNCGHWNSVPVEKIFVEQPSPEREVKVLIPMYEPIEVVKWVNAEKY